MKKLCLLFFATGAVMAADDRSKSDQEKLRGTWVTVSLKTNGKTIVKDKARPAPGPETKLVYDGDNWKIQTGDKVLASGKFKVDATKSPKEIDIFDETGVKNEKTKLGIYELNGDTYTYCLAPANKPRPTEFVSKEGGWLSLGVSRREK
jgi:uncharacterized protein (TIGR03067 family)